MIGPNGLFVVFDWLIDGPWWAIFLKCLLFTPIALVIIAPLFESRWLPLDLTYQFVTFIVGDVFLALFVATITSYIRESAAMPIDLWYHLVILAVCFAVAWFMTHGEMKAAKANAEAAYTPRAVRSPTKIYHNYVLYGGYAYVMVALTTQVILQDHFWSWSTGLVFVPFLVWLTILLVEGFKTPMRVAKLRARFAHIDDWKPIWENDWHVRQLIRRKDGGVYI
jgi:hypothetical protein